jgi:hypothetical protein
MFVITAAFRHTIEALLATRAVCLMVGQWPMGQLYSRGRTDPPPPTPTSCVLPSVVNVGAAVQLAIQILHLSVGIFSFTVFYFSCFPLYIFTIFRVFSPYHSSNSISTIFFHIHILSPPLICYIRVSFIPNALFLIDASFSFSFFLASFFFLFSNRLPLFHPLPILHLSFLPPPPLLVSM